MKVLVIDADPIIYAAGFAAQTTTYEYVFELEGNMIQKAWADGNEALAWIREHKPVILDKTVHVEAKDLSFARQAAKTQIESIIRRCSEKLDSTEDEINVEIYLSGPDNFRYKIATIAPYKDGRAPPPVHYQALRDYLTQRWSAVVVSGVEADDRVSIRCRELAADTTPFVLATIDKDLDQVPGLHYEYKNHVFYVVDGWDAEWTFWKQVLAGDSTDNIRGCYKVGVGKAEKLLTQWLKVFGFGRDPMMEMEEWRLFVWSNILNEYHHNIAQYPEKFPPGMLAHAAALENARLVFMMEHEGQLWNPPGVPHGELAELSRAP